MDDVKSDVTEEELIQLLAKVDKESNFRKLSGWQHQLVFWLAVSFSCFHHHLTGLFGLLAAQLQRSIHLSLRFCPGISPLPFQGLEKEGLSAMASLSSPRPSPP